MEGNSDIAVSGVAVLVGLSTTTLAGLGAIVLGAVVVYWVCKWYVNKPPSEKKAKDEKRLV